MDPATLIEAAYDACTALDAVGTKAVLTGGSAATFYAPTAYQSDDIDFVLIFANNDDGAAAKALQAIGFVATTNQNYKRRGVLLEFPPGPLALGSFILPKDRHNTFHRDSRRLYILTETDAVCNRLESYYAWRDFSSRAAAVAIVEAQFQNVDLPRVKAWTNAEYEALHSMQREDFNEFLGDLKRRNITGLPKAF